MAIDPRQCCSTTTKPEKRPLALCPDLSSNVTTTHFLALKQKKRDTLAQNNPEIVERLDYHTMFP
ncbi:hypothetical protein PAXINDRAFT_15319 [Paxillus involutus ATCC 200175]|uniref:Uncharacterized protein n=1 Tax=Paxillus involutus ATCC 200175 TaxID=664439 RepID=A0A0C9T875_PAXIN|nr:hypothetical protein PAXINDRAFT_15319 [Paxillus involutus ATCC 200175]